jgi:uncharacterized membrane protein
MKQARLDQLADSIFAIVMTILVFEIRIPDYVGIVSEQTLLQSLVALSPIFLSYLLSFSLLFTYWRSHHFIESILAKNIDTRFSNLNAIFFLFVGLVPFSSHFLGSYSYSKTAIIFFAINIILIGLSLFRMRQYVIKSKTIENASFTKIENEHANLHILFPVGAAIVAIFISFWSTDIAILLFTLAILFNFLEKSTKYTFFFIDIFRKK